MAQYDTSMIKVPPTKVIINTVYGSYYNIPVTEGSLSIDTSESGDITVSFNADFTKDVAADFTNGVSASAAFSFENPDLDVLDDGDTLIISAFAISR